MMHSSSAGHRITRCHAACDITCLTCDTLVTLFYIKPLTSELDSYLIVQIINQLLSNFIPFSTTTPVAQETSSNDFSSVVLEFRESFSMLWCGLVDGEWQQIGVSRPWPETRHRPETYLPARAPAAAPGSGQQH